MQPLFYSVEEKELVEKYSQPDNWLTARDLALKLGCSPMRVEKLRERIPYPILARHCRMCIKPLVHNENRYCTRCKGIINRRQRWMRTINHLRHCTTCKKFTFKYRFCSVKCRKEFHKRKKIRYDNVCGYCGEKFKSRTINRKFCSLKCLNKWRGKREHSQRNWGSTSRIFAEFICLLRDNDHDAYLKIRKLFRKRNEDNLNKDRFDKRLAKFYKKFNEDCYRSIKRANKQMVYIEPIDYSLFGLVEPMTKNYTTKQYWKNLWRQRFIEQFRRDKLPEKKYLTLIVLTLELDIEPLGKFTPLSEFT